MSYIKKLIAMVLTFAMTLSMASIATIQAMQSPIEFNKSKTYAVISKTRFGRWDMGLVLLGPSKQFRRNDRHAMESKAGELLDGWRSRWCVPSAELVFEFVPALSRVR